MQVPLPSPPSDGHAFGIPSQLAQPALQSDAFKELVNKIAWALGTTYHVPYANQRTVGRRWATELAKNTIASQGYPARIGYPK